MIDTPLPIYVLLPSSIFILLVSLFLFFSKKTRPYLIFLIIGILQFFWIFGTYIIWQLYGFGFEVSPANEKLFSLSVFLIPVFLYHFSVEFCKVTSQRMLLLITYLISFVFVFITDSDKIIKGLFFYDWKSGTDMVYIFFLLFLFSVLALTFYNFLTNIINKREKRERKDIFLILLLSFSVFGIIFIEYLPLQGINIYPLFYLSVPIYALIIAYILIEKNPLALVITTDILVTIAIAFPAAFVVFQEIQVGIVERSVIFILVSVASFMLLRHSLKLKNLNREFEQKLIESTEELENSAMELINIKYQLEGANEILEKKIKERTEELEKLNQSLEEQVKERTIELKNKADALEEKILELQEFSKIFINRENKMVELKNKIKKLEEK